MEVSGQFHAPAAVTAEKEPQVVPNGQEAEWVPEPVWNFLLLLGKFCRKLSNCFLRIRL